MAQPLQCDAHQAPGVLLMNTLIPPVESLVFCPECLPAQVVLMFEQLGLAQEFADVVRAEERAKMQAEGAGRKQPTKAARRAAPADVNDAQADEIDTESAGQEA